MIGQQTIARAISRSAGFRNGCNAALNLCTVVFILEDIEVHYMPWVGKYYKAWNSG
jgi:hypothetical protein